MKITKKINCYYNRPDGYCGLPDDNATKTECCMSCKELANCLSLYQEKGGGPYIKHLTLCRNYCEVFQDFDALEIKLLKIKKLEVKMI
jgi:hypothetical protein